MLAGIEQNQGLLTSWKKQLVQGTEHWCVEGVASSKRFLNKVPGAKSKKELLPEGIWAMSSPA